MSKRTHVYSGYGQRIFGLETDAGWAVKTEGEANVVLYTVFYGSIYIDWRGHTANYIYVQLYIVHMYVM